jgi:hypothetical protein
MPISGGFEILPLAEKASCMDEIFVGHTCFVGVGENITAKIRAEISRTSST